MQDIKPILKNFNFISSTGLDSYEWDCPDLIGYYEATIISQYCLPTGTTNFNINNFSVLNSPQIVNSIYQTNHDLNDGGFKVSFLNYVYLGRPNTNTQFFQNMKIIMKFNGKFYQEFLLEGYSAGSKLYRRQIDKYSLVMSLKPYVAHPDYKIGVNPIIKNPRRQMITIYDSGTLSYINKYIGLSGRYKVTPILCFYLSSFPENIGISIYSSQISTTIPNDKRFYAQGGALSSQRGQIFCNQPPLEGEFCGYFDLRFYSIQNNTEEALNPVFFQFMFEKL